MKKINWHSPILHIFVCCLVCIIPFLSLIFHLPGAIIIFCILLISSSLLISYKLWNNYWRISGIITTFFSFIWLMWSSICWPYWNSELLVFLLSKTQAFSKSYDEMICRNDAFLDLKFTNKYIKKNHPIFLDSIPNKYESEYIKAKKAIESSDSISINQLYIAIQSLVATLHDTHTNLHTQYEISHNFKLSNYGTIIEINGKSVDSFFYDKLHLLSYETIEHAAFQFSSSISSYENCMIYEFDFDNGIDYTFVRPTGDTITIPITKDCFAPTTKEKSNTNSQSSICDYWINDSNDVAYYNIRSFVCYMPQYRDSFRNKLSTFFEEVNQHDISNIIIDLRENPGGNNGPWHDMLEYLSKDTLFYGTSIKRRGPFTFTNHKEFKCTNKIADIYSGNIYALTSCQTFSSAMEFADCLQGNHLAKIVGESPGNTPNCYTNITQFCLPKSRLHLSVSTEKTIESRPGIVNNRIVPDYECPSKEALKEVLNIIKEQNACKK